MVATWTELAKFWAHTIKNELVSVPKPTYTQDQYPDLSGQVWLVTGATGGIGLEIATKLAQQNARVWITGRDAAKVENALITIHERAPKAKLDSFLADLADLSTIEKGVAKILAEETKLNGVIHNAGVIPPSGYKTRQGFDLTVGVNVIGPHLLQKHLDALILRTPDARIVWTSSMNHAFTPSGGFKLDELDHLESLGKDPIAQYNISKALNLLQAVQWSKNHPQAQVKSIAAHPGIIRSDLSRSTSPAKVKYILSWLLWPTEMGTYSPLYAALNPDVPNNAYTVPFGHLGVVRPDVYSNIRGPEGEKAWEYLDKKVAPYFPSLYTTLV